jgi:acetyl esterase/lipase
MNRLLVATVGLAALTATVSSAPPANDGPAAPPASPVRAPVVPVPPPDALPVQTERNVPYDTIGGEKLYLDIARPKQGGPYPCVVLFHGGGWVGGHRRDLSVGDRTADGKVTPSFIEQVASHGYVAVSAGYRLAPKHPFPAQIQDARAAVRFLRANAKGYGIDGDKVAACGFSAGGHLALLLGLADKVAGWDAGGNVGHSPRVQCVVDYFGPVDLSLYAASPGLEDGFLVPVFGKACKTDPAVYKTASPLTYAGKGAPPVLMIHGTFDLIVPVIHSEALEKKLKDAGGTAELIAVRGRGHGWDEPALTRTFNDAIKFFDAHLKGKP